MSIGWTGPRRREQAAVDPGLQSERTAMAWQRTALGLGGVAALLLHQATGNPLTAAPGVAGMLVALVVLLVAEWRYEHTVRRVVTGQGAASPGLVRTMAFTSAGLAAAALVLLLFRTG